MAQKGINWNIVLVGGTILGGLYLYNKIQKGAAAESYTSGLTGETISTATQPTIRTDLRQTGRSQRAEGRQQTRRENVYTRQTEQTARTKERQEEQTERVQTRQEEQTKRTESRTERVQIRQDARTERQENRIAARQVVLSNVKQAAVSVVKSYGSALQNLRNRLAFRKRA